MTFMTFGYAEKLFERFGFGEFDWRNAAAYNAVYTDFTYALAHLLTSKDTFNRARRGNNLKKLTKQSLIAFESIFKLGGQTGLAKALIDAGVMKRDSSRGE